MITIKYDNSINVSTGLSQSVEYQYRVVGSDAINRLGPYSQYMNFTLDSKSKISIIFKNVVQILLISSTDCATNHLWYQKEYRKLLYCCELIVNKHIVLMLGNKN